MVPVNYQEHTVVIAAVVPMDRTRGADTPPWWSDCQLTTEDRRCLKIAFVDVPSSVCPSVLLSSSREKDTSDDVILILLQKSAFVGYVRWGALAGQTWDLHLRFDRSQTQTTLRTHNNKK
jgi:hypothetical protein